MKMRQLFVGVAAIAAALVSAGDADACSRVLYVGDTAVANADSVLRIVGRSLDWKTPIPTNIYTYPAGMKKVGYTGDNSVKWTSKYGAVYAVSYDGGITEGMNEKGLVINSLFCRGAVYNNASTVGKPEISMAMFVGWLLDMNATTADVVKVLRAHDFALGGATFDEGTAAALHWGITDATGHSAVVEFDKGDINIYEGQDIKVLTNLPQYPAMEAINAYWEGIGGQHMLPGTVTSPDRFVRGSFFEKNVVHTNDVNVGLPILRSIMYNVSVPYLYTVETQPNVSSTQWRSYANLRDKTYGFETATNLGVFWVDLKRVDLRHGAPVRRLDVSQTRSVVGDATALLKPHKPFTPMY